MNWLVLVHQVPPSPAYLRAKVLRRVSQLGALPLKRSAYVMPSGEAALEDLEWLRREIVTEGGDAWILESRFVGGIGDEELRERFSAMRSRDYRRLAEDARALLEDLRGTASDGLTATAVSADLRRLRKRLDAIRRIDFFEAEGWTEAGALMAAIERQNSPSPVSKRAQTSRDSLKARTWATRAGIKVDRMASAWLIRRFIDPAATFVFLRPDEPPPAGAIRFDMFEGEFTHDGDRCTFEMLLKASDLAKDPGLIALSQIVHDIDLRDERYQRVETPGISALIDGIVARSEDDQRRIAESGPLFESLYATLSRTNRRPPPKHST